MGEFSSFDGTTIVYDDLGEGPPVVMLHGFAADARRELASAEGRRRGRRSRSPGHHA